MTNLARRLPPDALGLGLRPAHFSEIHGEMPDVGFFEIIAENFLGVAELPRVHLDRVAAGYPVVAHNISLNLLGTDPLDTRYLERLRWLIRRHGMPFATDHLAWTSSDGERHHDLLPVPCSASLVPWAAARVRQVQDALGVPFGIDARRVVATGIAPTINTGIAHKKPGIGQVGAGVVRAPLECFRQAVLAAAEALS